LVPILFRCPLPRPHPRHFLKLNFISKTWNFTMQVNVYQEGTKMDTEVNERPYHWFQQVPISYPKITNVMSDVSFNSMKAVWICWSRFILDISLVVYIFKVAVILYNIWYFCTQSLLCCVQFNPMWTNRCRYSRLPISLTTSYANWSTSVVWDIYFRVSIGTCHLCSTTFVI